MFWVVLCPICSHLPVQAGASRICLSPHLEDCEEKQRKLNTNYVWYLVKKLNRNWSDPKLNKRREFCKHKMWYLCFLINEWRSKINPPYYNKEKIFYWKNCWFLNNFCINQNCLVDIFTHFGKLLGSLDTVRTSYRSWSSRRGFWWRWTPALENKFTKGWNNRLSICPIDSPKMPSKHVYI